MVRRVKRRKSGQRSKPEGGRRAEKPFNPVLERKLKLRPPEESQPAKQLQPPCNTEEDLFSAAMSDVVPLQSTRGRVTPEPDPRLRPQHAAGDDELETLAHLCDLVSGNAEMDITYSDEYIEGCVPGLSPKLMRRLKKGRFPVQDHVDLHGMTQIQAEQSLHAFLINCRRRGYRCVLVIHGRGLNSKNNIPVLKDRLPLWLRRGPFKRLVLGFCTARPFDGGTGAIYVLLRRWR